MTYRAPLKDMLFVMKELAGLEAVAALPGYADAGPDTAAAVLEECARFNEEVVAPLNWEGDRNPSSFHDGEVRTPLASSKPSSSLPKAGGRGCSTLRPLVVKACPS